MIQEGTMIKYLSKIKGEENTEELTKERARELLSRAYEKDVINDIINNEKGFCLTTPTRVIWTDKDGLVPLPGFYGVCE